MGEGELTDRLQAQHRRNRREEVQAAFLSVGVQASFLPDDRQLTLLAALRSWARDRETDAVVDAQTALGAAAELVTTDQVVVIGDDALRYPAVVVSTRYLFAALQRNPFFADRNGLLLIDPEASGAMFIDYHAAEFAAQTEVTQYGAWRRRGLK